MTKLSAGVWFIEYKEDERSREVPKKGLAVVKGDMPLLWVSEIYLFRDGRLSRFYSSSEEGEPYQKVKTLTFGNKLDFTGGMISPPELVKPLGER